MSNRDTPWTQPHFLDWELSGDRLIVGYDPNLYPENERVTVCEVNPSGEAPPFIDKEWRLLLKAAPALVEALAVVVNSIETDPDCPWLNSSMHNMARAALRQARGEQP